MKKKEHNKSRNTKQQAQHLTSVSRMTDDCDGPPETAASNGVKQQSSSVSHGGDISDSGFGIPRGNV